MNDLFFTSQLRVYDTQSHRQLRSCAKVGNLRELPEGSCFCIVLQVQNRGTAPYQFREAFVRVDGREPWRWTGGVIQPSETLLFRIYPANMRKCMTPGAHTAVWYFDQKAVHQDEFFFFEAMRWDQVFPLPGRREIEAYKNPRRLRSPYLASWLQIPSQTRFTEYQVHFQAGHLPKGTYCCLGQWKMDHTGLKGKFRSVRTEYPAAHGYAGFQRLADGRYVGIMSFWDVYGTDRFSKEHRIRAKLLYPPKTINGAEFTGEGTGARCIVPFAWEENHWYRMHLRSFVSPETGTTLVEQWVVDLETGEKRLLCCYDTLVPDSCFLGSVALFLENFTPGSAGEIRSMEVCDAMYRSADTGRWEAVTSAYMHSRDGLPRYEGSYRFGVSGKRMWMITSGVGGDWFHNGKGVKNMTYSLDTN